MKNIQWWYSIYRKSSSISNKTMITNPHKRPLLYCISPSKMTFPCPVHPLAGFHPTHSHSAMNRRAEITENQRATGSVGKWTGFLTMHNTVIYTNSKCMHMRTCIHLCTVIISATTGFIVFRFTMNESVWVCSLTIHLSSLCPCVFSAPHLQQVSRSVTQPLWSVSARP